MRPIERAGAPAGAGRSTNTRDGSSNPLVAKRDFAVELDGDAHGIGQHACGGCRVIVAVEPDAAARRARREACVGAGVRCAPGERRLPVAERRRGRRLAVRHGELLAAVLRRRPASPSWLRRDTARSRCSNRTRGVLVRAWPNARSASSARRRPATARCRCSRCAGNCRTNRLVARDDPRDVVRTRSALARPTPAPGRACSRAIASRVHRSRAGVGAATRRCEPAERRRGVRSDDPRRDVVSCLPVTAAERPLRRSSPCRRAPRAPCRRRPATRGLPSPSCRPGAPRG